MCQSSQMRSLQASIGPLSNILKLNPHTLYERQLALAGKAGKGLLPPRTGRGPGSGTPFSPETVGVLTASMLATDNIKDSVDKTRALLNASRTSYSSGKTRALGGAQNFREALINVLSSDDHNQNVSIIRIHRTNLSAQIFLASGGEIEFKSNKAHDTYDFGGITGFYQIMGGVGGALTKIRELLRNNDVNNFKAATTPIPELKGKRK